jgi:hypothetical protein
MRAVRRATAAAFLALAGALAARPGWTQDPAGDEEEAPRPGLFHLGPVYVTPRLNIGAIGIDTNVFYTSTDRRTDFIASGGPGLEIVLPMGEDVRLITQGNLYYLYFAETVSQRRLTGDAEARLEFAGENLALGVEGGYQRTFNRPSIEVDVRVDEERWRAESDLSISIGERFGLDLDASFTRYEVAEGQEFFGADLARNLTRDEQLYGLEPFYELTPKTSLFVRADYQRDRFPLAPIRDADSNRLSGGLRVSSRTLLSGQIEAGWRSFRPRQVRGEEKGAFYADIDLTYHLGPRTEIAAEYRQDLQYSAFATTGDTPTVVLQAARLSLEKDLVSSLDLRLRAMLSRLKSDGAIALVDGEGETTVAVRDDTAWLFDADLGYTFRSHLRFAVAATYSERQSNFADFGVDGLLVGARITYEP